jgi:hypothetical protein
MSKAFSIIFTLMALSYFSFAKIIKVKSVFNETDLKIVDSHVVYYMTNPDVIKYIAISDKENKTNNKLLIQKMKGVCFSQINLNKTINDKDITLITQLLKSDILVRALHDGKCAVQFKGMDEATKLVEEVIVTYQDSQTFTYITEDSKVIFKGDKKNKK